MFWVSDLRGKGPLSRLWQACHQPGKLKKTLVKQFDIKEGYEAILDPSDDRVWALRLNGQLLLGLVRIHSLKIKYMQESIVNLHDRLKNKFLTSSGIDMNLSKASKGGKAEGGRNKELQMSTAADLDFILDIPDEVPSWLQADDWEMSQALDGLPAQINISAISSRRSAQINLPDNRAPSSSGYAGAGEEDPLYSDILEIPGGEMPEELELDIDEIMSNSIQHEKSSTGVGGGFEMDMEQMDLPEMPDRDDEDLPRTRRKGEKEDVGPQRKRAKKGPKLDANTQLSKDEIRQWVTDSEWVQTHLCKTRAILGANKQVSVRERFSMPTTRDLGKSLKDLFKMLELPPKPSPKKRAKLQAQSKAHEEAEQIEAQRNEIEPFDAPDMGFDMPEIQDYPEFDAPSDGGNMRSASEEPERIRAASEDSARSKDSGLMKGRRSDGFALPSSFDHESPSSQMGSSLVSAGKSRVVSMGGDGYDPLSIDIGNDEGTPFKSQSLKEEPESYQSNSQLPISQRLSEFSVLLAKQVAKHLPDDDSEVSLNSLIQNLNARSAARCFYSTLVLVTENVIQAEQEDAEGDIILRATDNTALYAA